MELTQKEKDLFSMHDANLTDTAAVHIENELLDIYWKQDSYDKIDIVLGYVKRMILEVAKKKGYNVDANQSFDIDSLLEEKINVDERLVKFKPTYYKHPEALDMYFKEITKNIGWKKADCIRTMLVNATDSFRSFFVDYVKSILEIANNLEWELTPDEEFADDVFNTATASSSNDVEEQKQEEVYEFPDLDGIDWNDGSIGNVVSTDSEKGLITEENLNRLVKFINTVPLLLEYRDNGFKVGDEAGKIVKNKKLNEFYSDEDFSKRLDAIMSHDKRKSEFYYHGTQCLEDAVSIIEQGLGMTRKNLYTTACSEFTKDEVILYHRGFDGSIGEHAIVIIDVPIDIDGRPMNIVRELKDSSSIRFSPSGLQGLDNKAEYIVDSEYIVGYVDKDNKKIIFNPKYKDYNRFSEYTSGEVTK